MYSNCCFRKQMRLICSVYCQKTTVQKIDGVTPSSVKKKAILFMHNVALRIEISQSKTILPNFSEQLLLPSVRRILIINYFV